MKSSHASARTPIVLAAASEALSDLAQLALSPDTQHQLVESLDLLILQLDFELRRIRSEQAISLDEINFEGRKPSISLIR